jgi:hypothetical protein
MPGETTRTMLDGFWDLRARSIGCLIPSIRRRRRQPPALTPRACHLARRKSDNEIIADIVERSGNEGQSEPSTCQTQRVQSRDTDRREREQNKTTNEPEVESGQSTAARRGPACVLTEFQLTASAESRWLSLNHHALQPTASFSLF